MAQKTTAENLARCKELDKKVKFITLPILKFLKIKPAVNNRNSARRAKKEYKKFIKPAIPHRIVMIAEYDDEYFNHDSNTRAHIWQASLDGIAPYDMCPVPKEVKAFVGSYDDYDEMEADYYMYDNQLSVESKADKMYGLSRIANMHMKLPYFGDLNGFSGLPSALKHMYWTCQQQKAKDGDAGLVQLFRYFRNEWVVLDKIIMDYISNNPGLTMEASKVGKKDIPVGDFNLFNSDGKAVLIASCLAILKKYNGTKLFNKAKKVIKDLLNNTEPLPYMAISLKGKVSDPLDLVAFEFTKSSDNPLHWSTKHVPSGGFGKDPNHEVTHQHSDRCAFVLYMLEAKMFQKRINPRKLFKQMESKDKKFPPNKVEKSVKMQKELGKYEKLLDKTAGWDCRILQLATFGFCLSDRPSELAKEYYE